MKIALFATAVAANQQQEIESTFINYLSEHGKSYGTREEFMFRLTEFKKKHDFIQMHNSMNSDDHEVGHNHMSDWTEAEYKKVRGYK